MEVTDFLSFRVMRVPEDTTEAHEHTNSFCLKFEETGGEQRQTAGPGQLSLSWWAAHELSPVVMDAHFPYSLSFTVVVKHSGYKEI